MKPLPVNERFLSWQGEGIHIGKSAYFIRLQGCPVKCPWCDSASTWHPGHTPGHIEKALPSDLAAAALAHQCEIVVITGGEPAIHNLHELTTALAARNLPIHIETSGAFTLQGQFDWVTLSPKWQMPPLDETLAQANELKIIVETPDSPAQWAEALKGRHNSNHIWLHPEWSKAREPAILDTITNWVKKHGHPYRAGYQLHKLYGAE